MELNIDEVAEKIDWEIKDFVGSCYAVSLAILDAEIVEGEAEYGHYRGPVDPISPYAVGKLGGLVFQRHGWIRMKDGTIVDATRWVFTMEEPYIAVIASDDPLQEEYDMGGNRWRKENMHPMPEHMEGKETKCIREMFDHDGDVIDSVQLLAGPVERLDYFQVCWLASLPLDTLDPYAVEVFEGIERAGWGAAIPIDNRRHVLGRTGGNP